MASRNVLKVDVADSYYHVYARGASRRPIFNDDADFAYFLGLFHRYLSSDEVKNSIGIAYAKLNNDIELICYCLMQNHFHLLVYQTNEGAMQRLMRGVMTSYSRYFNKKYERTGSLFETRYKASRVANDSYLMHISRYIHLNHHDWQTWKWSSYRYFIGTPAPDWLMPEKIAVLFHTKQDYIDFVADYEDVQRTRDDIKKELANS